MTTAFVPYRERAEYPTDTATLRDLKAELDRVREVYGRRSGEAEVMFNRLCVESAAQGNPIWGLRRHVADETERFFAQTIPGADGHVYWDGPPDFRRNDGRRQKPARWWWAKRHGAIKPSDPRTLRPTCGEINCINPEHQEYIHMARRRRASDEAMLGALQVWALRHGRAPTKIEWDGWAEKPWSSTWYDLRFGGWVSAVKQAGLVPAAKGNMPTTRDACVQALRHAAVVLHRKVFTGDEFEECRSQLRLKGLPASEVTIRKYLGRWRDALREALGD